MSPFTSTVGARSNATAPNSKPCGSPPAPVRDLLFDGFYKKNTAWSEVDESALAAYNDAQRPLKTFEREVIRRSDAYISDPERHAAAAHCVLEWLYQWAGASAYLGRVSTQGGFVRKWSLAAVSLAYLKIRDAAGLDRSHTDTVERWIREWADIVHDDYSTGAGGVSRRNNHVYWAAWSVGTAAVVTNDWIKFGWAVQRFRDAMDQIRNDGTLPLEVARRSKARHYHLYSLQALTYVAELAARNGIDLYGGPQNPYWRLYERVLDSLDDPGFFERLTGERQNWVGRLNAAKLTWMEPLYARFGDQRLLRWIRRFRPLRNTRTGGDATALYGAPDKRR